MLLFINADEISIDECVADMAEYIKFEDIDFDKTYEMDVVVDDIVFPVRRGDTVGKVVVYYKNRIIKEGELTVKRDVNSLGYFRLLFNEFRDLIVGEC